MRAIFCIAVVFDLAAFFSLSLHAGSLEPVNFNDDLFALIDEGNDEERDPASEAYEIQLRNEEYWTHGDVA